MFKQSVKKVLTPFKSWLTAETRTAMNVSLLLQGTMASWNVRSREAISSLQDVEFKVSSQWGEDGIIDWLVERANIPPNSRTFIEFGVEDYVEANTRFLLQNRNWRGLIMDGDPAMVKTITTEPLALANSLSLALAHHLTARQAFITRENINELISSSGFSGEVGLLSIDIDGNDYWVWEAIEIVRPIICICEYNAAFGDLHPVSIPYDPTFSRTKAHDSNLYYGASIKALCSLGARKGYRFVGTTSAGNDAFFVREDFAKQFVDNSLQHIRALPSLFREGMQESGQRNYIGGLDRLKYISALPLVNTETGKTVKLSDLGPLYSPEWLALMTGTITG